MKLKANWIRLKAKPRKLSAERLTIGNWPMKVALTMQAAKQKKVSARPAGKSAKRSKMSATPLAIKINRHKKAQKAQEHFFVSSCAFCAFLWQDRTDDGSTIPRTIHPN